MYIENLFILSSVVTEWVLVSAFASLVGISVGITNSAVWLKTCAIISRIISSNLCSNFKNNCIIISSKGNN